jgi:hypothetical protein
MTSIKLACLAFVAALFVIVSSPQVQAGQDFAFVSSTGSNSNPCTATQPCATIDQATINLNSGGQVSCVNSPSFTQDNVFFTGASYALTIDCAGVVSSATGGGIMLQFTGSNQVAKIRNLTFNGQASGTSGAIQVNGSGTLILEKCVFENFASGAALQIEPTGAFNLVVTDSRISNSSAGVLIQPASGGSVNATFDRVTITQNSGGAIKINTASGPVTLDITASEITDNTGNGLNAVSGAGGAAMFSVAHSVIADNGAAGIQANGASAAAMVDTTLLDSNASGATSVVASGRILTYGTNRIVGSSGSGFTGTASLQ